MSIAKQRTKPKQKPTSYAGCSVYQNILQPGPDLLANVLSQDIVDYIKASACAIYRKLSKSCNMQTCLYPVFIDMISREAKSLILPAAACSQACHYPISTGMISGQEAGVSS